MAASEVDSQYATLRDQVEGLLAEGKLHSRKAGEWEKVETYWHIGDALQSHFKGHPRAEYGQQVVRKLSKDTNLGLATLWDILLFRRSLSILYTCRELGWSHIRAVLRVATQEQRLYYLRTADEGRWSVRQLREAIRAEAYAAHAEAAFVAPPDDEADSAPPLQPRFGELHTYRVVPAGDPASSKLYLDLGFGVACSARSVGLADAEPGQIVTATPGPGSPTFTVRPARARRYTYPAWVQRVVDGDTLIAVVDLGLDHQTRPQRLRLRGIDCPELGTQAGRNARSYVQDVLGQVGFVVLTTHKTDAYGRYLADVRYLPGQPDPESVRRRGRYLNRELLEQRLARPYVR